VGGKLVETVEIGDQLDFFQLGFIEYTEKREETLSEEAK